mmetsp:Transcript_19746/g.37143  ORF Transcript_19746/g.37143 Transcript_19746/m.37143 type:complete len:296 (+) Transcript_19746:33-920(+)
MSDTVTEPPDAATWEVSAVAYVAIALAILISCHVYFECRGSMKWNRISWDHVAGSSRGFSYACVASYRLCFFLVVLATNVVLVQQEGDNPLIGSWICFATFTVWSWSLIGLYCLLAAGASILEAIGKSPEGRMATVFCCATWVLFEVMLPVSCLIFLLVWTVLLPAAYQTYGSSAGLLSLPALAAHNLNFVFMFVETMLNRLCITTYHLVFMFYYGGIYVIFSWLFFAKYHFFFYFFIDWRYPLVLFGYTGLLSLLCTFFFVGRCIVNCVKPPLYASELDESCSDIDAPTSESDA